MLTILQLQKPEASINRNGVLPLRHRQWKLHGSLGDSDAGWPWRIGEGAQAPKWHRNEVSQKKSITSELWLTNKEASEGRSDSKRSVKLSRSRFISATQSCSYEVEHRSDHPRRIRLLRVYSRRFAFAPSPVNRAILWNTQRSTAKSCTWFPAIVECQLGMAARANQQKKKTRPQKHVWRNRNASPT